MYKDTYIFFFRKGKAKMKHKLTRLTSLMLAFIMAFSMLLVPVEAASFQDVSDTAWYKAAVDYVHEKGWMNGVSETEFAPNMDVTRAMFVTVLSRFADEDYDRFSSAFEDVAAFKLKLIQCLKRQTVLHLMYLNGICLICLQLKTCLPIVE